MELNESPIVARLRDIADDDQEVIAELVGIFDRDTRSRIDELRAALARADLDASKWSTHSLKGSCGNMGFEDMYHLCQQLEKQVCGEAMTEAAQTCELLERAFVDLREQFVELGVPVAN
jgi:HPt (histidine-containing phosphotransfer) domain-containing protein